MNKFLEFSFKIGKILSSILLIIVLFVILGCTLSLFVSSQEKVTTPTFQKYANAIQQLSGNQTQSVSQNENTKNNKNSIDRYDKLIAHIIKSNQLLDDTKREIKYSLRSIPEEYRNQYLKGLDKFYKDGFEKLNNSQDMMDRYLFYHVKRVRGYEDYQEYRNVLSSIKSNGKYNKYLCNGLLFDYDLSFRASIEQAGTIFQEQMIIKIIMGSVLCIALLIFAILLFLPVLIRIEENTRPKVLVNDEETKDVDMKICPKCGKIIKKSAQKCRYCGEWLNNN